MSIFLKNVLFSVNIYNFIANGNEAKFDFEYGANLGAFCAELFPNIPSHDHNPFAAEALKSLSGKNIGKWKIKKKTTRRLSEQKKIAFRNLQKSLYL